MRYATLALATLALACGDKDGDSAGDSGICADAPVTDWDNFGAGFFTQQCQPCHASALTGSERNGAPEGVMFDAEEQVLAQAAAVVNVATGEDARMPPMGGVTEDERYRLEVWLTCYAE